MKIELQLTVAILLMFTVLSRHCHAQDAELKRLSDIKTLVETRIQEGKQAGRMSPPFYSSLFEKSVAECTTRLSSHQSGSGGTVYPYTQALEFDLGTRKSVDPDTGRGIENQILAIEFPLVPPKGSFEDEHFGGGQDLDIPTLRDGALATRLAWMKYAAQHGMEALARENGQWPLSAYEAWTRQMAERSEVLKLINPEHDTEQVRAIMALKKWFDSISEHQLDQLVGKWALPTPDGLTAAHAISNCKSNATEFIENLMANNPSYASLEAAIISGDLQQALNRTAAGAARRGIGAKELAQIHSNITNVVSGVNSITKDDSPKEPAVHPGADVNMENGRDQQLAADIDKVLFGGKIADLKAFSLSLDMSEYSSRSQIMNGFYELADLVARRNAIAREHGKRDAFASAMASELQVDLQRFDAHLATAPHAK